MHVVIIAVVGLLIYSNTFDVPFIFDDDFNIAGNPLIRNLRHFTDNSAFDTVGVSTDIKNFFRTRLIGYLSLAINYKLNGLDVTGYHIFNLVVHIINACLIYQLIILILNTPFFSRNGCLDTLKDGHTPNSYALPGALLFISHPVATQAVTYIVQRFTSLATLFYLLSVVMYVKAGSCRPLPTRAVFYALSVTSALCAMKTKEIAFTLPMVIVLCEFMFFDGGVKKRLVYLTPILLTLLVIPLTLIDNRGLLSDTQTINNSISIASSQDINRWDYLITQFRVVVTYMRLLFLPVHQNFDYDYPIYGTLFNIEILGSLFLILSVMVSGIWFFILSHGGDDKRIFRLAAFGISWFFLCLSVESGIIPIADVIFEHRLYLPMVGFSLVFVTGYIIAVNKLKTGWITTTAVILITLTLAVATYERNGVWHDKITFWLDVVKKSPNKARPHLNLGAFYAEAGDLNAALTHYQTALSLNPNYPEAHNNIGNIYEKQGDINAAIRAYQTAINLQPKYLVAHSNLGNIRFRQGQYQEALAHYQTVLTLRPDYAEAHYNLGSAYGMLGRDNEAIKEFQTALRLNPDDADARKNLEILINTQ
ncbi:MAG: tetratricopeptide repeat protein [Nitrospirae bacterium]|nr:tetratricopeptide repeat protein [Nitrospirota bacterium]